MGNVIGDDLHLDDAAAVLKELMDLRAVGAGAVVEMSCLDFNRSLQGLRGLATASGLAVVAATGFRSGQTCRAAGWALDWEKIAAKLEHDVLVGEAGVTCGVVKAGSGRGQLSDMDRATLRAAARAQVATGAPVSTHTDGGELALAQLDALEAAGGDLTRVAIGHLDRERDRDVHREVLKRGAYVIYDQIGKGKYGGVEYYRDLLQWVEAGGYGNRVMLSSDFGRRSYLAAFGGEPGLPYLLAQFSAEMISRGVSRDFLQHAMLENPARFFACERGGCEPSLGIPSRGG